MSDPHPLEISGQVILSEGNGGLAKVTVTTPFSTAEIYPHGAHITGFQKKDEPPLLFMSAASAFDPEKAIRGGVPIIFPWFGGREGFPAHGFARTVEWDFTESSVLPDQSVRLVFRMPAIEFFDVAYIVTVGETLGMELVVRNTGENDESFESCLHSYFQIGAIQTASVHGLKGCIYFDKVLSGEHTETGESIRISSEVDRVYCHTVATVVIEDPTLGRKIVVSKSGSDSTVVWNPWIDKSKAMADFGDEEYHGMICVESGNVAKNRITLPPGEIAVLKVDVASEPLG